MLLSTSQLALLHLQVHVPPHPLIKHWLAVARNVQTPPAIFRSAVSELSRILLYECVRDMLPTLEGQVETPMGVMADVEFVDPTKPIAVVPVLRAGMAMLDQAMTTIPNHITYHVGYMRDEETLEATSYLNKLPDSFDMDSKVLITDIMLATGAPHPHRSLYATPAPRSQSRLQTLTRSGSNLRQPDRKCAGRCIACPAVGARPWQTGWPAWHLGRSGRLRLLSVYTLHTDLMSHCFGSGSRALATTLAPITQLAARATLSGLLSSAQSRAWLCPHR